MAKLEVNGKPVTLNGNLTLGGWVHELQFGGAQNGTLSVAQAHVGGASMIAELGNVTDESLSSAVPIHSLKANQWVQLINRINDIPEPIVAIAPLLVLWLGFGIAPKILVAVLIAFFPVVISGVAGLRSVDPELLDLAATMGAKPWDSFAKIRFPHAMPHIFAGLKVAVTLAVVGAVVGEFVGANSGLGYIVMSSNGNLNTPQLFAALIAMSLIGIVLFVVLEIAEHFAIPWRAAREERDILVTA